LMTASIKLIFALCAATVSIKASTDKILVPKKLENFLAPLHSISKFEKKLKNVRAVPKKSSEPSGSLNLVYIYEDATYLAHGTYLNSCLCGESETESEAYCQVYQYSPSLSTADQLLLSLTTYQGLSCDGVPLETHSHLVPTTGNSTITTNCDAGEVAFDLPFQLSVSDDASAYQSLGKGILNFQFSRKEDCESNAFTSYYLQRPNTCGQGPEGVCIPTGTWVPLSTYSVHVTAYEDTTCTNVIATIDYSFESQKCSAIPPSDDDSSNDLANYQTVMFQGF